MNTDQTVKTALPPLSLLKFFILRGISVGVNPESPASLDRAEVQLRCVLPISLKWLLNEWGYAGACGISSLADAVTDTLRCRDVLRLPAYYIILNDWGDAGVVYLDSRSGSVTWTDVHGLQRVIEGSTPVDADNFPDFPAWAAARLEVKKAEAEASGDGPNSE